MGITYLIRAVRRTEEGVTSFDKEHRWEIHFSGLAARPNSGHPHLTEAERKEQAGFLHEFPEFTTGRSDDGLKWRLEHKECFCGSMTDCLPATSVQKIINYLSIGTMSACVMTEVRGSHHDNQPQFWWTLTVNA